MGVDEGGVAPEMQDMVWQSRDLSPRVARHHNSVVQAGISNSQLASYSQLYHSTAMHLEYKS